MGERDSTRNAGTGTGRCDTMLRGIMRRRNELFGLRGSRGASIGLEVSNRHEAIAASVGLFSANDNAKDHDC